MRSGELLNDDLIRDRADSIGAPVVVHDWSRMRGHLEMLERYDRCHIEVHPGDSVELLARLIEADVVLGVSSCELLERARMAWAENGRSASAWKDSVLFYAFCVGRRTLGKISVENAFAQCGSPDVISQLANLRPGAEIGLDLNIASGAAIDHGIWHTQLDDCLLRADQEAMMVTRLRVLASPTNVDKVCGAVVEAARSIGRTLRSVIFPPFVGGTEVDRLDETCRQLAERFGHPVEMAVDAGNFARHAAGRVIAEVRAVKRAEGAMIAVLDIDLAGQNAGPDARIVANVGIADDRESLDVRLVGRTGWPINADPLTHRLPIPRVGDWVVWTARPIDYVTGTPTSVWT